MTASHVVRPASRAVTDPGPRTATPGPPSTDLRALLLRHLALDVRPSQLATVVIALCAAIEPMLARPPVMLGARATLSDREVQVLLGMATGSSNAQIGRALHLSEDTVKTYARRLYANLGVRDRAHAVARAFQQGILLVGEVGDRADPRPLHSVDDTAPATGSDRRRS